LAALTSGGGQESVCGWLKDKYGLSWQVCPENWEELNKRPGAFKKMMGMKKLNNGLCYTPGGKVS